jgi:ribose 1,5-bisphosphate isomerase
MPISPLSYTTPSDLPGLPPEAEDIIQKIQSGQILGASRSIRLINQAFCIQVNESPVTSGKLLAAQLRQWADYLVATRGALSPAVGNAIGMVLKGLEEAAEKDRVEDVRAFLLTQTEAYNQRSLQQVEKIAQYGANLLQDGQKVLAYDYSSSVNSVLRKAAEDGKRLHVVIPESRALNGGLPILREMLPCGHRLTFTVDVAIGQELKGCAAVLVGAESLIAEGGFWTTIGTCSTAILAHYYHVPFYVPTELIKFDPRSEVGFYRHVVRIPLPVFDFQSLSLPPDQVAVECDDLEYTPRELITAYITEEGLLPPAAVCLSFKQLLNGTSTVTHP